MSLLDTAQGASTALSGLQNNLQGVLGATIRLADLFPGVPGNAARSAWQSALRPASYGGVPFGVLGGQIRVGRRNAVHEYPYKDQVWVEDLGRAARRITLTGFLVENAAYGGGPVIAQRERLIAACESPGQNTLVHPTLGSLKVSLIDSSMEERWDQGRVFEISFSFIEAGERVFPSAAPATGATVQTACSAADFAASADFAAAATFPLAQGASVVGMAVSTAAAWAGTATTLARDASNLMNTVGRLPGSFSRYFGGRNVGVGNLVGKLVSATATLPGLIAAGTAAREAVGAAATTLGAAAAAIAS